MREHKYRARFAAFARALPNFENKQNVATAALNDLANIFQGKEIHARILSNPDLLFWASNLALLDHANLNDDALRKADGLRIYKNFILKLLDIEHNRSDVVGSIYEAGFSLFPSNKVISYEEAVATNDVVQLVVGGYIWRVVAGELCDLIEQASLETSASYGDVSTSFELAFDDYDIGIGPHGDRNINHARIIKRGEEDFDKYDKMLRVNKGKGKTEDGDIVYRILGGDILPLGAGVVGKPASGLKGILALNSYQIGIDPNLNTEEKDSHAEVIVKLVTTKEVEDRLIEKGIIAESERIMKTEENVEKIAAVDTAFEKYTNELAEAIFSVARAAGVVNESMTELNIKLEDLSVTNNTTTLQPMKLKTFDELAQNWADVKKLESAASLVTDLKEVAQAATRKEIEDALALKSEEFSAQLKAEKDALKAATEAKELIEKQNKETKELVASLQKEISELKAAQQSKAAEDAYDRRIEVLTQEFDLDDEDMVFIVEEVKNIPDDETFAKYLTKQKKLLAAKKKKAKAEFPPKKEGDKEGMKEDMKHEKEECASVNAGEVVASVTEKPNQEVPNTVVPTENLAAKVRKIMGESVIVNKVKMADVKK